METLAAQLRQTKRALASLGRALAERPSSIVRDSVIKRFDYSFDLTWKKLRRYLLEQEGLSAASPKSTFREALRVGLLDEREAEQAMGMTDDRNKTSHTYDEHEAREVYRHIRRYYPLLTHVMSRVAEKVR